VTFLLDVEYGKNDLFLSAIVSGEKERLRKLGVPRSTWSCAAKGVADNWFEIEVEVTLTSIKNKNGC
jgi:hypothetical protein